ncbi:hypothetical protein GCM10009530_37640 [Microbispora corallina]|uniref:Uncharacterized protein n=1 Tax=Microbispora corallina TaxID=83302 RepID=A0ABQ4G2A6_9ACTN|nr:hypothetical protein Mco01_42130 [Microbispora corallina]
MNPRPADPAARTADRGAETKASAPRPARSLDQLAVQAIGEGTAFAPGAVPVKPNVVEAPGASEPL